MIESNGFLFPPRAAKWAKAAFAFLVFPLLMAGPASAQPDSLLDQGAGDLDSLLNLQISSVAKYDQTTQEAPASVTLLTHEDIRNYGYNDMGELLNAVRDFYITWDRNYTYIGVRGYGRPTDYNNRVAVMINGVVLNENLWGAAPIGTELYGLDIDAVERVEIVRGPASALYGNYPMLAMINIVTHTGKSHEGLDMSVEQGSYGKWQGSADIAHVTKGGVDIAVSARAGTLAGQRLYYEEYDDSLSDGIADKLDWSNWWGMNARISYKNWILQGFTAGREVGVPTGAYSSTFADPRFVVSDRYSFLMAEWNRELDAKTAVMGKAWGYNYRDRGAYPLDSADGGYQTDGVNGLWAGGEVRLQHDLSTRNRIVAGIDGQRIFMADYFIYYPETDTMWYDKHVSYSTYAAFLQDEWQPIQQLSITAGLRLDKLYLDNIALTPRLAVNFFASQNTTLKLLYGRAFRAPNAYEANIEDPTYIKGNPDLKAEHMRSLELVYEQRIGKQQYLSASAFHQTIRDVIDQVLDPSDSLLQYQNIENSGGFGASAEWTGRFKGGLNGYASYSFADMRNGVTDAWLTNSPRHMVKAGVTVPIVKHLRLSPEMIIQSGRLTVYDTETKPFAYFSCQLLVAPKVKEGSFLNRMQLAFKVRNLLDTDYRYPGGFEHVQPSIRQNGRNYNLKLTVHLF